MPEKHHQVLPESCVHACIQACCSPRKEYTKVSVAMQTCIATISTHFEGGKPIEKYQQLIEYINEMVKEKLNLKTVEYSLSIMTVTLVRAVMAKFGLAENIENKNTHWDFYGLRRQLDQL